MGTTIKWNGIDVVSLPELSENDWYLLCEPGYLYDLNHNCVVDTRGGVAQRRGIKVNADGTIFTELEVDEKPLPQELTESQCPTCFQERVMKRLFTSDYYFCEKCNK